ncbi:MAG: type II secretion system major pseudopilin GspG [Planctomycetota bacterium]|nr:type II secretion system major pseudopilin GspG [Planctomycetota bacterium]
MRRISAMDSMLDRRRARLPGFTLVEMMVVIVIIGIMATVLITYVAGQSDQARIAAAKGHIAQLDTAVQLFKMQNGRFPGTLAELMNRPPDAKVWPEGGYVKTVPKDPWGGEYVLRVPGSGGRPFEIYCWGADMAQGGEGVNADITNYEEAQK